MTRPRSQAGVSAVKLALAARAFRADTSDPDLLLSEPIAIVGMACRFPGGAHSVDDYWSLLVDRRDAIVEVPRDRWDVDAYFDPDPDAPGKMTTRWGGFLQQPVALFDPLFFGIAPREAASLDPQQRLLLEVAWEAIEDAGLTQARLAGSQTGVYFAIYGTDYAQQLHSERAAIDAYATLGTVPCMAAGRLSFLLDLQGPSLVVDTACSSSLVAIHLAAQSLRTGECRTAIAGGVSLTLTPDRNISLSKWRFMSPDGRCKAFDARADGWVRGEGAGVIVLKRLGDALADGDRVLAILRGSALNQDGRSNVLTAPNGEAQKAVVRAALASARVAPADVTFVEAHGTGTRIGDPIELEALADVLGAPGGPPCRIGAVKNNIGHLEAAAGVAGVIKTVLALTRELIPANIHFETLNPLASLDGTRIDVPTENTPWPASGARRFAGVSSFGFSGTNAHVVLEEAPVLPPRSPSADEQAIFMLPLSARSPQALSGMASAYATRLRETGDELPLVDVCHTAATRRTHHDYRAVAIGSSRSALAEALGAFARGERRVDVVSAHRRTGGRTDAVWVFSGQGSQWPGMGRELFEREPVFRGVVEQIADLARRDASWSLVDELRAPASSSKLDSTAVAQPAIFALQAGIAALLRSWGIEPGAVVGHSVGEVAAAHVAGVLDVETAVRVVMQRARVMQQATGLGRMAAVGLSADELREQLGEWPSTLSVAAVNGPRSITVSGEPAAVTGLVAALERRQIFARMLPVDYAFHSEQMDPYAAELADALGAVTIAAPTMQIVSTVTGRLADASDYDARYWARNVRQTVQFWPAIEALIDAGHAAFLEIGPHPVLAPSLRRGLDGRVERPTVAATLERDRPERIAMRTGVAQLHAGGCAVDWPRLLPPGGRVVSLPAYAWQRQRYWAEVGDFRPAGAAAATAAAASQARVEDGVLGRRIRTAAFDGDVFETGVSIDAPAYVRDHEIHGAVLFPASAFLAMAHAGLAAAGGTPSIQLERVSIQEPLRLSRDVTTLQLVLHDEDDRARRRFRIASLDEGRTPARWKTHVTGTGAIAVRDVPSAASETPEPISLEPIRARCVDLIDADTWYAQLRQAGFAFGPSFRTVKQVWACDGEALAEVVLPSAGTSAGAGVNADANADVNADARGPLLIDGCLQAIWAALPERIRRSPDAAAYMPVDMATSTFAQPSPLPARLFSHVIVRPASASHEAFVADVRAYDDRGQLVWSANGVTIKRASRASLMRATTQGQEAWRYEIVWHEALIAVAEIEQASIGGTWIVLGDNGTTARDIADAVAPFGSDARVVDASRESVVDAIADVRRRAEVAGIIDCRALDAPSVREADDATAAHERMLGGLLDLVQALTAATFAPRHGVIVLTRGAAPVDGEVDAAALAQTAVHGFLRTLALEHPELAPRIIDLDPAHDEDEAARVAVELHRDGVREAEVAFRRGTRFVSRLVRMTAARPPFTPVQLESEQKGQLDRLVLRPATQPEPDAGEVVIAVEAAGLNFRDVLNALDMYPGDAGPFGNECVGRIVARGSDVTDLAIGDRVVALALAHGCLGSFARVPAALVVRCDDAIGTEDAATLPVAFATARYGLTHLARMRAGDRVLIHAAAGGVGLAAVQLAQRAGAEVFATAGSAEKHAFLRAQGVQHIMSSRTLDFADEIRARTDGRGVDIVLNSLSGEFITKSLDVLASGGRFVEIGKTDIWTPDAVAARRPDVEYHVLYLGDIVDNDPTLGQELLRGIVDDVANGVLQPLTHRTFELGEAVRAFRFMAQARHIGKIVLKVPAPDRVVGVRGDATYLITGGLGALGLAVAEGLAAAGARHLLLVGRREPAASGRARIDALRAAGVDVVVRAADVTNYADVAQAIASIDPAAPLRGVIHAAGVLDDGLLVQQSRERVERVLAPKVRGAWHLHAATRRLPLDFFVLFSSAASVIGSAGQAAYGAANAFMDGLAHARRAEGLPAISINWGAWADGGMVSSLDEGSQRRWTARGIEALQPAQGVAALLELLGSRSPQVTVMPIAWSRYAGALATKEPPSLVRDLVRDAVRDREAASPDNARDARDARDPRDAEAPRQTLAARLTAAPASQRKSMLSAVVVEQTLKALGLPPDYPLDAHQGLRDLGLDSLMAVELRNRLQEIVDRPLPVTLAFDSPTPEALTMHLLEDVLKLAPETGAPAATPPTGVDDISDLSDAEAEELLRQELDFMRDRLQSGPSRKA